jgi:hypothetical protein
MSSTLMLSVSGSTSQDGLRRRDEGHRARQHLLALHLGAQQAQVQGRRRRVERHGVLRAGELGEALLEGDRARSATDPAAVDRIAQSLFLSLPESGPEQSDAVLHGNLEGDG